MAVNLVCPVQTQYEGPEHACCWLTLHVHVTSHEVYQLTRGQTVGRGGLLTIFENPDLQGRYLETCSPDTLKETWEN